MQLSDLFPAWGKLSKPQQELLAQSAQKRIAAKGMLLHSGADGCTGLVLVASGQLRAYILSDEGREITLYRLFERDMCLFSAACILNSIQFDIAVEAERDAEFWLIPPDIYKELMEQSAAVANYTNEVMASRFSDVMWLIEQVMWKSFDKRLAQFLLEESALENSAVLTLTHETIAKHLGSAREVVTRMLRYFQGEGWVRVSRGTVTIVSREALQRLSE